MQHRSDVRCTGFPCNEAKLIKHFGEETSAHASCFRERRRVAELACGRKERLLPFPMRCDHRSWLLSLPRIGHAADCGLHETFIATPVYNLRHTILRRFVPQLTGRLRDFSNLNQLTEFSGDVAVHSHRFHNAFGHFLCVAEKHHGVVAIEQGIVNSSIPGCERALDEHHRARLPHLQHRHTVDRRRLVVFRRRIGDVVRADNEGDIGLRKF